uniref:Uncharacterized protein n=1 Tax=Arundo donax TaxID=35708 RepID=A0A0A9H8R3_ARUDO
MIIIYIENVAGILADARSESLVYPDGAHRHHPREAQGTRARLRLLDSPTPLLLVLSSAAPSSPIQVNTVLCFYWVNTVLCFYWIHHSFEVVAFVWAKMKHSAFLFVVLLCAVLEKYLERVVCAARLLGLSFWGWDGAVYYTES